MSDQPAHTLTLTERGADGLPDEYGARLEFEPEDWPDGSRTLRVCGTNDAGDFSPVRLSARDVPPLVEWLRDHAAKPSIFGRDRAIVDRLAEEVHEGLRTEHDHTPIRELRRGSTFEVRLASGHIARVIVELDRYEEVHD